MRRKRKDEARVIGIERRGSVAQKAVSLILG